MKKMDGIVDGNVVAIYKRGNFTWTCRISNGFYCATFNVRQTNRTYYSRNKEEINNLIKSEITKGFKKIYKCQTFTR